MISHLSHNMAAELISAIKEMYCEQIRNVGVISCGAGVNYRGANANPCATKFIHVAKELCLVPITILDARTTYRLLRCREGLGGFLSQTVHKLFQNITKV